MLRSVVRHGSLLAREKSRSAPSSNEWGKVAMYWATSLILKSAALMWFIAAPSIGDAGAQERQRIFFHASGENSKYTKQYAIDVPDMPGHQVRIYEIRRAFPIDPPKMNGLAIKEIWTRGMADYTEDNGHGSLYSEYVMENGDRFFSFASVNAQRIGFDDYLSNTVGYITGGTGQLERIEGVLRTTARTHPKAGTLEVDTEIQYSMRGVALPK
jgi:hypothetical protein